ncbi:hypothetical protein KP509_18G047900 [Ceratopteris richardii]|uniref:Auxin-responsive protein n=1 Tax=Ceratopteris richardii TaxID=49495 RepID=A0A8T2ST53_CERRI|nr:hypothetical protein KP509_18G047900 [Ceratopteris richardii]KAH7365820.1 hypothetical protein KP509_18G047900 [Ceratopteris richardii]
MLLVSYLHSYWRTEMEHLKQDAQQLFHDVVYQKQQHGSLNIPYWEPDRKLSALSNSTVPSSILSGQEEGHHGEHAGNPTTYSYESSSSTMSSLKEHDYIGLRDAYSDCSSGSANNGDCGYSNTDLRLCLGPQNDGHSEQTRALSLELQLSGPKQDSAEVRNSSDVTSSWLTCMKTTISPIHGVKRRAFGEELQKASHFVESIASDCASSKPQKASENLQVALLLGQPAKNSSSGTRTAIAEPNERSNESKRFDSETDDVPTAKDQVVGWPPIPSYRKSTFSAAHSEGVAQDEDAQFPTNYVKVNMDGIPIGRKIDLNIYLSYQSLGDALEEMFYSSSNGNSRGFIRNGAFVLTYEDKEGDLMLVGDVPWKMFTQTVKRIHIVRGLDTIGLAART